MSENLADLSFSSNLDRPEKCQDCPRLRQFERQLAEQDAIVNQLGSASVMANTMTVRARAAANKGLKDPQRLQRQLEVNQAYDRRDQLAQSYQAELDYMASDCIGPIVCEGASKLGNKAVVTVCGSATLEGNGDETVNVSRA